MSRNVLLNALFIVAGCTSVALDAVLYRIALIVIVLLLRALWARAAMRHFWTQQTLDRNEQTLDLIIGGWNDAHQDRP